MKLTGARLDNQRRIDADHASLMPNEATGRDIKVSERRRRGRSDYAGQGGSERLSFGGGQKKGTASARRNGRSVSLWLCGVITAIDFQSRENAAGTVNLHTGSTGKTIMRNLVQFKRKPTAFHALSLLRTRNSLIHAHVAFQPC